jgi:hypothetical protein
MPGMTKLAGMNKPRMTMDSPKVSRNIEEVIQAGLA